MRYKYEVNVGRWWQKPVVLCAYGGIYESYRYHIHWYPYAPEDKLKRLMNVIISDADQEGLVVELDWYSQATAPSLGFFKSMGFAFTDRFNTRMQRPVPNRAAA